MDPHVSRRFVLRGIGAGLAHRMMQGPFAGAERMALDGAEPITVTATGIDLVITAVSEHTLRVTLVPGESTVSAAQSYPDFGVAARSWPDPLLRITRLQGSKVVPWGKYSIRVSGDPLGVAVENSAGKLQQDLQFDPANGDISFFDDGGPLFGLGEGGHQFDRRGISYLMRNGQHEPALHTEGARLPIPWLIGSKGWGIFFHRPLGRIDLAGVAGKFVPSENPQAQDIFLVFTDTPALLLREYAKLTGFPHMPPLWALGYQQSHRTLASRQEVLDEARTFRDKQLPCDVLIYLGTGFCPSGWNTGHGSFVFNPTVFPDPAGMFQQLHDEHFRIALHVVRPPFDLYGKVSDTGLSAQDPSDAAMYWSEHLQVFRTGVDGWWADEGDPLPVASRIARNRMYWEGPILERPDVRPYALHRNGYAGLQQFGWLWSGDVFSTWKTLQTQIAVGINTGLSGIPYWGTDTGGFVPTKEFTAELFVRWFQFSSFCPLFRGHGRAWKLRLPWGWDTGSYDPPEYDGQFDSSTLPAPDDLHNKQVEPICRKYLNLRYQLLSYLYSMVYEAHQSGMPIMRALWLEHPDDEQATAVSDSYLFGSQILVAPVVEPGARHRKTYLPQGLWYDFWTSKREEGKQEVSREVDLGTVPLYVKAGSILPFGPVKQFALQSSREPLTIMIFPGVDGQFFLYEDDGFSLDFQRERYSILHCVWKDRDQTFTLSLSHGTRLHEFTSRSFVLRVVGTNKSRKIEFEGAIRVIQL